MGSEAPAWLGLPGQAAGQASRPGFVWLELCGFPGTGSQCILAVLTLQAEARACVILKGQLVRIENFSIENPSLSPFTKVPLAGSFLAAALVAFTE